MKNHIFSSHPLRTFSVAIFGVFCAFAFFVYANDDVRTRQEACIAYREHTEPVTNGSCSGRQSSNGTQTVVYRVGSGAVISRGECVSDGNWTWVTKVCTPTYMCQDNPDVDLSNASIISVHEQSYENPPAANEPIAPDPIFPLSKNYLKTIVAANNSTISASTDGCEYSCDDGYRLSTGICAGGVASSTLSCTVAPTITLASPEGDTNGVRAVATFVAPPATLNATSQATITNPGSGYDAVPTVTLTGGNCNFYPIVEAQFNTTTKGITNITIRNKGGFAVATANASGVFIVDTPGSGYIVNNPAVTITSGSCTPSTTGGTVTLAATVTNGSVTGITVTGGTCTAGTIVNVAEPTGLSVCTSAPTLTIAAPSGTSSGVTATATVSLSGSIPSITITNQGSGYRTSPQVTFTGGSCTGTLSAFATVADGKVTSISLRTTGTQAYAVSNATGTAAIIPTNGGGSGYTSAPTVSVTGGKCTTLPTATATIANGSVTGVALTNAVACTEAPILTIAPPKNACTTGSTVKKCIPLVCTGTAATNATYCENDTNISGHEDQPNVYRQDQNACTANAKCEWYCPVATPYYCQKTNMCVIDQVTCDGTIPAPTCKTFAPSELKQEYDVPLIQCDAIDITKTHFRYKITKTGGNANDTYISPLYAVGTAVKHPTTFSTGSYTVSCLYGTATSTNSALTDYGMTSNAACVKTMTVNSSANGCKRIIPYRGSTLSNDLSSGATLDASFRCSSREVVSDTADTKAYRFQIGTNAPTFFGYDRFMNELFENLAIGPASVQTGQYSFSTSTDVFCAMKVGDGYSTNVGCQRRTCVGESCVNEPETFVAVASADTKCTNSDSISYEVGCNPTSQDYLTCLDYLYRGNSPTMKVTVNGNETEQILNCASTIPPGALGPVKTCTIHLPSVGGPITLFSGDKGDNKTYSFQTTVYAITKDTGKPTLSHAYYTDYTHGIQLSADQESYWQRQPVTAEIICSDTTSTGAPGKEDGSNCACASVLSGTQSEVDLWSFGSPSSNTSHGPDVMKYIRRIANNIGVLSPLQVKDTAGNVSVGSFAPDIGIDSIPPKLQVTSSGGSVTLSFTDNHPGASGLWKFSDNILYDTHILKGGVNENILYRTGPNLADIEFGDGCTPLPTKNTNYYTYAQTKNGTAPTMQTLTQNIGSNFIAYCIQDNAGNTNRGYYPNNVTGCFSSDATLPTPVFTHNPNSPSNYYATLLANRLTSGATSDIGYSFSANTASANGCFRGILSENINARLATQLTPKSTTTLSNWETDLARVIGTSTPNSDGFYYYAFNTATNNTVSITTSPTGDNEKSVVVEGGNIQINTNIEYSGTSKVLVLIARKGANGGGNIYVNPSVTRIDAVLIADGGYLLNGSPTAVKDWNMDASVLSNRLVINGRLYSYNTRGGSLAASGTNNFVLASSGKYFIPTEQIPQSASGADVAKYDLERFRLMLPDGNVMCTTHINYRTLDVVPTLLKSPVNYSGGSCSF